MAESQLVGSPVQTVFEKDGQGTILVVASYFENIVSCMEVNLSILNAPVAALICNTIMNPHEPCSSLASSGKE